MDENPPPPDRLDRAVRTRRERKMLWETEGERPIGRNLAMIGALGWSVVVPTLIGLFAGRWLDRTFNSGLFWTLGLLTLGVAVGCFLAWKRIYHE